MVRDFVFCVLCACLSVSASRSVSPPRTAVPAHHNTVVLGMTAAIPLLCLMMKCHPLLSGVLFTSRGGHIRVQAVDVKRKMNVTIAVGVNVLQRLCNHLANAQLIHLHTRTKVVNMLLLSTFVFSFT